MTVSREETQRIIDRHRAAAGGMMMRRDYLVPDCFEEQAASLGERADLLVESQKVDAGADRLARLCAQAHDLVAGEMDLLGKLVDGKAELLTERWAY